MSVTEASGLPVRSGEDKWTEEELGEVRRELESDIALLRDEIAKAESDLAERLADAVDGAGDDPTDTGAKAYQREHDLALAYNTRDLLAQSERAIERMEAGTYGVCESCGDAIGKARLQAFPRATLCVKCKQREERR
ncbi:TraR/DksA family transcriptional regulator [Halostreptopolyspora alba]|uniref:TraR/DksA family transcriptional regulator n=1 Tax=Halostreptopolyspora alba TaxID=2487137 RepID=A0A3N0EF10_9ACTN|nr:TraR/DksA family transcriptional regulator [Nocardiopsaceae bacterium YIM 96095]